MFAFVSKYGSIVVSLPILYNSEFIATHIFYPFMIKHRTNFPCEIHFFLCFSLSRSLFWYCWKRTWWNIYQTLQTKKTTKQTVVTMTLFVLCHSISVPFLFLYFEISFYECIIFFVNVRVPVVFFSLFFVLILKCSKRSNWIWGFFVICVCGLV